MADKTGSFRDWPEVQGCIILEGEGFDDAVIGITIDRPARLIYSTSAIEAALERGGMTQDEAEEYAEFNIYGAYMGPRTPVYVTSTELWE